MERVANFDRLADHYAGLADHQQGRLGETYRTIEAAYRVLAMSVRIELWWPGSAERSAMHRRLATPGRAEQR